MTEEPVDRNSPIQPADDIAAGSEAGGATARRPKRVLFVCLGNICRSPTAEGLFRAEAVKAGLGDRFEIDSAGTGGWHQGEPPDRRAVAAAAERGVDISLLRARQIKSRDFDHFDLILAMDASNYTELRRRAPRSSRARIAMITDFAPETGASEVGDPYYGGPDGFVNTLDLLEACCRGLLKQRLSGQQG